MLLLIGRVVVELVGRLLTVTVGFLVVVELVGLGRGRLVNVGRVVVVRVGFGFCVAGGGGLVLTTIGTVVVITSVVVKSSCILWNVCNLIFSVVADTTSGDVGNSSANVDINCELTMLKVVVKAAFMSSIVVFSLGRFVDDELTSS